MSLEPTSLQNKRRRLALTKVAIASNDSMEGKLFQIHHKLHGVGPVAVVSAGSIAIDGIAMASITFWYDITTMIHRSAQGHTSFVDRDRLQLP